LKQKFIKFDEINNKFVENEKVYNSLDLDNKDKIKNFEEDNNSLIGTPHSRHLMTFLQKSLLKRN